MAEGDCFGNGDSDGLGDGDCFGDDEGEGKSLIEGNDLIEGDDLCEGEVFGVAVGDGSAITHCSGRQSARVKAKERDFMEGRT